MPDSTETKAVKRMMRWVTLLTAMVVAPTEEDGQPKAKFPDAYSAAIVTEMMKAYRAVQQSELGFGLLNDKSLDGLFLHCLLNAELSVTPWGKALQHLVLEEPVQNSPVVYLSRLPFILLPQECVVTGESLSLTTDSYNITSGGQKGKVKLPQAKDGWKAMKAKIKNAYVAFEQLEHVKSKAELLEQHRENFSILWDAYKVLVDKVETPYTPRYQLFKDYQQIPLEDLFLPLFFEHIGREAPIQLDMLPPMFTKNLQGKQITDYEDASGNPVNWLGEPYGPDVITLKQLDDYFYITP